jgi:hypothetical protein
MTTRWIVSALITLAVTVVALGPIYGATWPDNAGEEILHVYGSVLPAGDFIGTLQIVACTLDAAGQLRLTGLLSGTAAHRTGARVQVVQQSFTAAADLRDPGYTTDVVRLALAPIALDSARVRIRLAPITVDIETLPLVGDELARR